MLDSEKPDEARALYQAALAIEPAHAEAHQGLARALEALGDSDAATPHWRRGFAGHNIVERPYRGRGRGPRVLLLVSVRSGNIPTNLILDDRMFAVSALYAEFFDPTVRLPEHDVVFNAIGDADLCGEGLSSRATSSRAAMRRLSIFRNASCPRDAARTRDASDCSTA